MKWPWGEGVRGEGTPHWAIINSPISVDSSKTYIVKVLAKLGYILESTKKKQHFMYPNFASNV